MVQFWFFLLGLILVLIPVLVLGWFLYVYFVSSLSLIVLVIIIILFLVVLIPIIPVLLLIVLLVVLILGGCRLVLVVLGDGSLGPVSKEVVHHLGEVKVVTLLSNMLVFLKTR